MTALLPGPLTQLTTNKTVTREHKHSKQTPIYTNNCAEEALEDKKDK